MENFMFNVIMYERKNYISYKMIIEPFGSELQDTMLVQPNNNGRIFDTTEYNGATLKSTSTAEVYKCIEGTVFPLGDVTIGPLFCHMSKIRNLPDLSNVCNVANTFCKKAKYVTAIPPMPKLLTIGDEFCVDAIRLQRIMNIGNVTSIKFRFASGCFSLKTLPDMSNVTRIGSDFCVGCA